MLRSCCIFWRVSLISNRVKNCQNPGEHVPSLLDTSNHCACCFSAQRQPACTDNSNVLFWSLSQIELNYCRCCIDNELNCHSSHFPAPQPNGIRPFVSFCCFGICSAFDSQFLTTKTSQTLGEGCDGCGSRKDFCFGAHGLMGPMGRWAKSSQGIVSLNGRNSGPFCSWELENLYKTPFGVGFCVYLNWLARFLSWRLFFWHMSHIYRIYRYTFYMFWQWMGSILRISGYFCHAVCSSVGKPWLEYTKRRTKHGWRLDDIGCWWMSCFFSGSWRWYGGCILFKEVQQNPCLWPHAMSRITPLMG